MAIVKHIMKYHKAAAPMRENSCSLRTHTMV